MCTLCLDLRKHCHLQNIGRYDCDCYCYYYYYYYYYYYIYIYYYIYYYYYYYYYYYCYYYYYYYSEDSEVPGRSNNRVISRKFSMGKTSFTTRTQQHGTHEKATLSHISVRDIISHTSILDQQVSSKLVGRASNGQVPFPRGQQNSKLYTSVRRSPARDTCTYLYVGHLRETRAETTAGQNCAAW